MDYKIIPTEEKHIKEVNYVVGVVAREKKYLSFLDAPSLESSINFITSAIKNNDPNFVVVSNNKVVGWCDINRAYHGEAARHIGVLGIGLLLEFRGRGIGRKLMEKAIDKAKATGITRVELDVREPNTNAIALYEKLGFKIEGKAINTIRIDGVYENTFSMALLF